MITNALAQHPNMRILDASHAIQHVTHAMVDQLANAMSVLMGMSLFREYASLRVGTTCM